MRHPVPLALALGFAMATHAEGPEITLYSGDYDAVLQSDAQPGGAGFALVRQPLPVELRDGQTRLVLSDLPLALDVGSLQVQGDGLRLRAQRYDFATPGQSALLQRALGRRITVEQSAGSELRRFSGILLAAADGLTLREDDGTLRVLSGFSSFTVAGTIDGLVSRPTLTLDLAGVGSGRHEARLGYATAGLGWRAEYHARLDVDGPACRMEWQAHALVANRSGSDFRDVRLSLVAGQPNRVQDGAPRERMVMMAAPAPPEAKMLMDGGATETSPSSEYHRYTLPPGGDLPHGSIQRLGLMPPASAVPCERRYEAGPSGIGWMPQQPLVDRQFGQWGELPVTTVLAFRNEREAGLGMALPAGRVRVFDGDDLLGEAALGHTAPGRAVRLPLGQAFDLSVARSGEDFQLDRPGRTVTETIEVVLRNGKSAVTTIDLAEPMQRWSDWEILTSTHPMHRRDAASARFRIEVPAGGETKLRYTVRYRWADNITVP